MSQCFRMTRFEKVTIIAQQSTLPVIKIFPHFQTALKVEGYFKKHFVPKLSNN